MCTVRPGVQVYMCTVRPGVQVYMCTVKTTAHCDVLYLLMNISKGNGNC